LQHGQEAEVIPLSGRVLDERAMLRVVSLEQAMASSRSRSKCRLLVRVGEVNNPLRPADVFILRKIADRPNLEGFLEKLRVPLGNALKSIYRSIRELFEGHLLESFIDVLCNISHDVPFSLFRPEDTSGAEKPATQQGELGLDGK
jgi:hypothetical protein